MRSVLALVVMLCALDGFAGSGSLTIYVSPEHPYSLKYDPGVWKSSDSDEADIVLQHHSGKASAVVIALEGDTTLAALRESALTNGRESAPDLKVVAEGNQKANGAEVLLMRVAGTTADGPVTHFGIYWAGPGKALQFIVSTTPDDLPAVDADVRALLEGFSISVEKRVPQEKRAFTVSFPPQKWHIKDDGTRDGVMLFEHNGGDVIGMASAIRVDVPKGGLRAFVIDQAKAIAPRVRVVSESAKDLDGAKVSVLHMEGTTTDGVSAVFLGYFYSGSGAYVQALTVVPRERFAARREDMTEFLDGLQIHLPRE